MYACMYLCILSYILFALSITKLWLHFPHILREPNHVLQAGNQSSVLVWDSSTLSVISELKGHLQGVACICFSPNGWLHFSYLYVLEFYYLSLLTHYIVMSFKVNIWYLSGFIFTFGTGGVVT